MGLFNRQIGEDGKRRVPVWFMRQAGRYHWHYQEIKKTSDFMSMCKTPRLACDVTLGPLQEFGFDAAILFSDLLFPLERLGMGLTYDPGPRLGFHLQRLEDIRRLVPAAPAGEFYNFQAQALQLLKKELPAGVDLLGFTGAPFTLYTYAAEGGHKGELVSAKKGLTDGRWSGFLELLLPDLLAQMKRQSGADVMCLFDTAAGELAPEDFRRFVAPVLRQLCSDFKKARPDTKLIYYSKHTNLAHLRAIECEAIDVLGIDWRLDITETLDALGEDYMIQGNLDPAHLFLPQERLKECWDALWERVQKSKASPDRWICGLGHGVLRHTPQENVAFSVRHIHESFRY